MNTITFTKRDFSGPAFLPGVRVEAEQLTWRAVGGPWSGRLRARAADGERLWALTDLLRCEVKVYDAQAAAWWGFVESVELHLQGRVVRASLDEVWNRVRVRYRLPAPGASGGEEQLTAWAEDAASIRAYGVKEKVFSMGQASAADAEGWRGALLAWHAAPRLSVRPAGAEDETYAILTLGGWWKTLDWQYYSQPRGQAANLHGGTLLNFGVNAAQRVSQAFTSAGGAWDVSMLWVRVKRVLAGDDLRVGLHANNAGQPGAELAYALIANAALEDELTWAAARLSTAVTVDPAITRHIVLSRSGALNNNEYFAAAVDSGLHYGGGLLTYTGSAWAAPALPADLAFLAAGVEDSGLQARDMALAGQFVQGARLEASSGIRGRLFRGGERRIRAELEELLRAGLDNGRAYLALIDARRVVNLYARPLPGRPFLRSGAGGELLRASGRRVAPSELPAGQWAGLGEAAGLGRMGESGASAWIAACVWEGGRLRMAG